MHLIQLHSLLLLSFLAFPNFVSMPGLKGVNEEKEKNQCPREGMFSDSFAKARGRDEGWVGGLDPGLGPVNGSPGPLRGHTSRFRSFWEGCRNEPVLFPHGGKRTRKTRS
jgi:hypothetical protein